METVTIPVLVLLLITTLGMFGVTLRVSRHEKNDRADRRIAAVIAVAFLILAIAYVVIGCVSNFKY